jgi:hypothetical protein
VGQTALALTIPKKCERKGTEENYIMRMIIL